MMGAKAVIKEPKVSGASPGAAGAAAAAKESKATAAPEEDAEGPATVGAQAVLMPPAAGGMWANAVRVVAMSDTHGFHQRLYVPPGDVLVHCGDANTANHKWKRVGKASMSGMEYFANWFKKLPHKHKVFVEGNHDYNSRAALGDCFSEGYRTICGLKIFGCGFNGGLGYGYGFGKKEVPQGLDLLLTHEPPFGVLDLAAPHQRDLPSHIGSREIRALLQSLQKMELENEVAVAEGNTTDAESSTPRWGPPRVHIFGHIHEARGLEEFNGTLCVNAAVANRGPAKEVVHGCAVLDFAMDGSRKVRINMW